MGELCDVTVTALTGADRREKVYYLYEARASIGSA
jgi:hypothetical protein